MVDPKHPPPPRYFVVAAFSQLVEPVLHGDREPTSVTHAQTWGSMRTMCGLGCETWTRWRDWPFPRQGHDTCHTCFLMVRAAERGVAMNTGSEHPPRSKDPR